MTSKVFQIDQECFLIYLEEFSNKKGLFIRIGNSPILNELNGKINFITIRSNLLPGNPLIEADLLKKLDSIPVIGLKDEIEKFTHFLKINPPNEKLPLVRVFP